MHRLGYIKWVGYIKLGLGQGLDTIEGPRFPEDAADRVRMQAFTENSRDRLLPPWHRDRDTTAADIKKERWGIFIGALATRHESNLSIAQALSCALSVYR